MTKQVQVGRTIDLDDTDAEFRGLVQEVAGTKTRVLVEKDGQTIAALVTARDLKRLAREDALDRETWEVLEAMRAPFRDVSVEELEREALKAVAEDRAERKAERERAQRTTTTR